jgi:hypothetical protein
MRDAKGCFTDGIPSNRRYPIGTIRIRTRHSRGSEKRAFIKIADPNDWILLAQYVWIKTNGPIPVGFGIHHKDENKLNDVIENLELVSKSKHLEIHRPSFADKCVAALVNARKSKKWTTKSKTKITGRHPKDCQCPLHR